MMIILNFSHPLTPDQVLQIQSLANQEVGQVIDLPVQFDNNRPFLPQMESLMASIPLTPEEYQTVPLLVNLPALNFIAALVLAYLHGVMGYFPSTLRFKPDEESLPVRYEVAEILNLQAVRDRSRKARGS